MPLETQGYRAGLTYITPPIDFDGIVSPKGATCFNNPCKSLSIHINIYVNLTEHPDPQGDHYLQNSIHVLDEILSISAELFIRGLVNVQGTRRGRFLQYLWNGRFFLHAHLYTYVHHLFTGVT